jgi:glucokinase
MDPVRTIVGVDMGGTKIAAALLRARSPDPAAAAGTRPEPVTILSRTTVPTDQSSPAACLDGLLGCIAGLFEADAGKAAGTAVEAIGIGIASMVDYAGGRIVASVNLPLNDVPLRDVVAKRFGVPATIDNDATVAAVGEHVYGAGIGTSEMLMLTLGTGVGGGIICAGRPYRGVSGAAAELGHIMIDVNGPECPANCPNRGCLEAYVSGPAMGVAAVAEARAKPASALGRALANGQEVDGRLLVVLARRGDPGAVAVLTRTGEYLGAGITTLVNIFNPELIVVGGGAAAAGELLLAPARRVLAARGLRPARDQVRIEAAVLGPDAGLIGAGALALAELRADAPEACS